MAVSIEMAIGDMSEVPKNPLTVRCGRCQHKWVAAYLPMTLAKVAALLKPLRCPMCSGKSDKIFISPEEEGK